MSWEKMRSKLKPEHKMLYAHQTTTGRAIEDCVRLHTSIIRVPSGIGRVIQPHTLCGFFF